MLEMTVIVYIEYVFLQVENDIEKAISILKKALENDKVSWQFFSSPGLSIF